MTVNFIKKKKDERMNTFYPFSTVEQFPKPLSSRLVLQKRRFDQPIYPGNVSNVDRQIGSLWPTNLLWGQNDAVWLSILITFN